MTEPAPFACTLTPDDEARRASQDRALAAQLLGEPAHDQRHATLTFPPSAQPLIDQFVGEESRCCSFFQFEVERGDETTRLHVGVPPGGEDMLRALVDAFRH